ncbi:MAG: hypothetical protein RIG63_12845 [Coleofasciculus chthonoplastes F3-SA18-01]|uniref:hypothetical protein n=1 Tax=Coleofasciculus chthonoplastes TaxID=64178 RepID=UPI003302A750
MGLQQLGLTDVTCSQESFERWVKGGAIATNLVELWHSPPSHVLDSWSQIARSLKRSTL